MELLARRPGKLPDHKNNTLDTTVSSARPEPLPHYKPREVLRREALGAPPRVVAEDERRREPEPRAARDLRSQTTGDAGEGRLRRLEAVRVLERRRRVGEEAAPRRPQALSEAPRHGRLAKVRAEAHRGHLHFIQRWSPGVAAAPLGDGRRERVLDARLGLALDD